MEMALYGALGVVFLWLLGVSFLVFKNKKYLESLFPEGESRQVKVKLEQVLSAISEVREENTLIATQLDKLTQDGKNHVQRVEVLRYNPYNDTGGDQSFTAILLDGHFNGVMITSLHSRSSTRIYTKIIKQGKSDLELSKEEKEVLEKATK